MFEDICLTGAVILSFTSNIISHVSIANMDALLALIINKMNSRDTVPLSNP